MVKSKLTINCDSYLLEDAKQNHINFSQLMEESLQYRLSYLKNDVEGINIKLVKLELERKEKKFNKMQQEVSTLRDLIKKYNEKSEELALNEAKKQKEALEKQKRCINCNSVMEGTEKRKFTNGYVCRACFLSSNNEQIKKWSDKA